MSFTQKTIRTMITLGAGVFEGTKSNSVIIEGLATDVSVEKPGLPDLNKCNVSITGLSLSKMEQLTMLAFRKQTIAKNAIAVWAGDLGSELGLVFRGEIVSASADFNAAPTPVFNIEAKTGVYPLRIPAPPLSVSGETTIDAIASRLAHEMGYEYKNEGVTGSVKNSIYNGSPLQKLKRLSENTGIELYIDDGAVVISQPNQPRKTATVPVLSSTTGLLGYPTFSNDGITLECIYNPNLVVGSQIRVESIVPKASGYWKITKLTHTLSAYHPGDWKSGIDATWVGEAE